MDTDSSIEEALQEQTKLQGRRSTVQAYSFLLLLSVIFLGIYTWIYVADEDIIYSFGMKWAFVTMLLMYSLDLVASVLVIIGITRELINDILINVALLMLALSCILNFAVFFALPAENQYGEPASWLPQSYYPHGCYYRYRGRGSDSSCTKLKRLATDIWCTFIIFFSRMFVLAITKCTISYAKYGAVYRMYIDQPPPTYVITSQGYAPYGYAGYPIAIASSPYVVQHQVPRPMTMRYVEYPSQNRPASSPNGDTYQVRSMSTSPDNSNNDLHQTQLQYGRQEEKPRFSYSSRRQSE